MTQKTAQIIVQISNIQAQISMLQNAQLKITQLQKFLAALGSQLTPDVEPDASAATFATAQITAAQAGLVSAATAVGATLTAEPASLAKPAAKI